MAEVYKVDYEKSKELTFKQLYGGVFKEYENLEFFKKTDFDENAVLNSIRKGKYDVIGVSVTHNKAYGEQKMISFINC